MRRSAAWWKWRLPVVWVAGSEPEPAPVQATVVHVVHHYVQLPDGQVVELPQQRAAITGTGEYPESVNQ